MDETPTPSTSRPKQPVEVDLADGVASGEGDDSLIDIERVVGSHFADLIFGTPQRDGLVGNSGDDSISAAGGNAKINGQDGNDTLAGAGGADRISGGQDDDTLDGESGNDELDGGRGADTCLRGTHVRCEG